VAIAGTQLKAVKSQRRNVTPAKLSETRPRRDTHIEPYMHDLDAADADEPERQQPTAEQLRERKGRDEGLMREMARPGQSQVSLTDPDSRAMAKSPNVDMGDDHGEDINAGEEAGMELYGAKPVTSAKRT
jgi:hypothetical protein